ncbi:HAMP domain-containing histidine kinase [bacterium SCSIO 12643]|nr:HAMP domain-containing histidine kinase [bacterium SCSIO 12643]
MRISTKLSITFSIIASVIFVVFGILLYWFSSDHRKNDFLKRLRERVEITEKIFLEKDSFSDEEFEKINDQFLHTLPQETEEVVPIVHGRKPQFKYDYPKEVVISLIRNGNIEFEWDGNQGVSKLFHVKGKDYLIIVTAKDEVGLDYLKYLRNIVVLLVLLGIPIIFALGFEVTKRALKPISLKIQNANKISASSLHLRLSVWNENDELGELAISFNKLLDRLESAFEAQKSFINNASHELRNPLTAILGEAELAVSKSRTNEEYVASLKAILNEAEILNSTVNNLLQLSKISVQDIGLTYKEVEFETFLGSVRDSYEFINPEHQLKLDIEEVKDNKILCNQNLLKTALINIWDNACKFSSNKPVEINAQLDNGCIILKVVDQGVGIEAEDLDKIATPFYRGKNVINVKGSGVGLSLSAKIIELHKGKLSIDSLLNEGTTVTISMPVI